MHILYATNYRSVLQKSPIKETLFWGTTYKAIDHYIYPVSHENDRAGSCVWYDAFIRVMWQRQRNELYDVRDYGVLCMTLLSMWHAVFIHVTWLIHPHRHDSSSTWHTLYLVSVWHDSFIHVIWLFIHVTYLVYTCDMTQSYVTWLIHTRDMTHSYI